MYIVYVINVVVAASVFEELLFRGVMLQALRRFGDHFAVIVTSILFAFIHGNLLQGPFALLLGLLIGYFVIYTGSLWTGILLHAANNLLSVLIEYFMNNAAEHLHEPVIGVYIIVSLIFAIIGVVYLRTKHGSLFYLRRGSFPLTGRQKQVVFFTSIFVIIAVVLSIVEIISRLEWL